VRTRVCERENVSACVRASECECIFVPECFCEHAYVRLCARACLRVHVLLLTRGSAAAAAALDDLYRRAAGVPPDKLTKVQRVNGAISVLEAGADGLWRVLRWNDVGHLDGLIHDGSDDPQDRVKK
jgi:hypothetical protein